uniref:Uncharacterized protein n=1 Tax=Physcomitrium patens TaxID=3218 RepID=A0A2K1JYC3_PHYPA|nr:hypothetical protein PHYPA_013642 [Physcomitrium patens]
MGLGSTLPSKTSACRRYQLCVMSSTQGLQTCSSSGKVLFGGACLKMSSRKKITKGVLVGTIRSESPTLGDDEPKELQQGGKSTASSFRKTNHLLPLAVEESAKHDANKTAEEDCGPQGHRVTFSNLSGGSIASQALHLASKLSEKAEVELTSCKSKKPKRLSTASWDLLD